MKFKTGIEQPLEDPKLEIIAFRFEQGILFVFFALKPSTLQQKLESPRWWVIGISKGINFSWAVHHNSNKIGNYCL